jgi:hypothetical protein
MPTIAVDMLISRLARRLDDLYAEGGADDCDDAYRSSGDRQAYSPANRTFGAAATRCDALLQPDLKMFDPRL